MESLADFQTLEGRRVYTVFSITRHIRENIEADPLLNDIWVEGEISSFHHHTSSGHYYFTIKDENAQIKCAAFKNVASSILSLREMKDGSKVLVKGDITLYPPRGEYSLRVRDVRLLGKGD
ncbi:MAG: exodeoxyribonuclease VII large subunit, partial [Candidatus Thermoplasmatota archaeon]|nr:exodeoxyribonuclease VII large subunit [Candidatus Thermoplasmatota archaeon]